MRSDKSKMLVVLGATTALTFSNQADSGQGQSRTTFSFVAYVGAEPWTYDANTNTDVKIELPDGDPWRCIRRKIYVAPDGEQIGTIQCSPDGDKTFMSVSAICGAAPTESHNAADIATAESYVSLHANCVTAVRRQAWPGF